MTTTINQKIVNCSVVDKVARAAAEAPTAPVLDTMHESLERPEALTGATFKIKSPLFEHALYITINDMVLNAGTPHAQRYPFEIFINSKNMEHFQWIVALTRILSAVFRKGGDVAFVVGELKAVFDPRGGYFKAGGVYMASIVAEIGAVIEQHLTDIGLIAKPEISAATAQLIADKRAAYETLATAPETPVAVAAEGAPATDVVGSFPPGSTLCSKCNVVALVVLDNCQTCLNCGFSKCG
jgi:hypothetical protein